MHMVLRGMNAPSAAGWYSLAPPQSSDAMKTDKEKAAFEIVKRLTEAGFSALYAGGFVRDMVLNLPEKGDIDIATSATPQQIGGLFPGVIGVGEHFGVMIVVMDGVPFEVATFRRDVGTQDGRHPVSVEFIGARDAREDALRRDFTINGMFFDPLTDTIIDHVHGRRDLERGIIRAIGDPCLRFSEDYLRLVRAIRFAARFGFCIEKDTWAALRENVAGIGRISAERIFQETDKILAFPHADAALVLLHESGLLSILFPEIQRCVGVAQPQEFHPEGDVFSHTVKALALLDKPTKVSAWSVLLHDIGKPPTMVMADRIRFSNHDVAGARMAADLLRRLKAPSTLVEQVHDVIANHMNFMNVQKMRLSTLKKFLARPTLEDEMVLHRVDCLASHGDVSNYDFIRQKQKEMPVQEIKPPALLSGRDLIALGMAPGPLFGKILGEAYDLQLEEKLTSREDAMEWVRKNYPLQNAV
jgi:tRNA nucleotidyltransferase/poly(A) polymerase